MEEIFVGRRAAKDEDRKELQTHRPSLYSILFSYLLLSTLLSYPQDNETSRPTQEEMVKGHLQLHTCYTYGLPRRKSQLLHGFKPQEETDRTSKRHDTAFLIQKVLFSQPFVERMQENPKFQNPLQLCNSPREEVLHETFPPQGDKVSPPRQQAIQFCNTCVFKIRWFLKGAI